MLRRHYGTVARLRARGLVHNTTLYAGPGERLPY